jgi:hypothetical protein
VDASIRDLSTKLDSMGLESLPALVESILEASFEAQREFLAKSKLQDPIGLPDTLKILQELSAQLAEQVSLLGKEDRLRSSSRRTFKVESEPGAPDASTFIRDQSVNLLDRKHAGRWPKTEDYPTYHGSIRSDHRHFLERIDLLKASHGLPDSEIIAKLSVILKGAVPPGSHHGG